MLHGFPWTANVLMQNLRIRITTVRTAIAVPGKTNKAIRQDEYNQYSKVSPERQTS